MTASSRRPYCVAVKSPTWLYTPAVILALTVGGCAGKYYATPTSDPVHGRFKKQMQMLEMRAPADLSCPAESISYKILGNTAMAAEGCEHRITYQYINNTWIMESSTRE